MPPAHPVTPRLAAALLVVLAPLALLAGFSAGGRAALLALDPVARWPLGFGLGAGALEALLGAAIGGLSLLTAALLVLRPDAGRLLAVPTALAWLPAGCGLVSLATLALAWWPADQVGARHARERATSAS